jgi:class 3 adenylate cyclase
VIEALNHYFDETSDAILEHGGTLVAYRGDGVLAAFGAPIEVEDHADRALETARDMVDVRLPRFNEWLRSNGLGTEVRMGIGLNSGPFMSGNVGSLRRLEYTLHGDTVNTASRIETLTKTLGARSPVRLDARGAPPHPTISARWGSGRARTPVGRRPLDRRRCRRAAAAAVSRS